MSQYLKVKMPLLHTELNKNMRRVAIIEDIRTKLYNSLIYDDPDYNPYKRPIIENGEEVGGVLYHNMGLCTGLLYIDEYMNYKDKTRLENEYRKFIEENRFKGIRFRLEPLSIPRIQCS